MSRLIAHFVYCEKDAWNQFSPDAYPNLMCWKKLNDGKKDRLFEHQEVGNEDATNRRGDVKDTDLRPWVGAGGHVVNPGRLRETPSRPSKQHCSLARGPEPITAEHSVAVCLLQMRFNGISSDDPEARCHRLLNNFLEASSGHCGNYLYVRPLKDMSTHGTSRQPAP